jgi:hypothetical protein
MILDYWQHKIGVFFAPFAPFCGNSMQVPDQEPFTRAAEFFRLKSSQTQSNPVKPFFYFDQTMTRPPLRLSVTSGLSFHHGNWTHNLPKRAGFGKSTAMIDRASRVLRFILDAPVVTVEPGFTLEARTFYGVHGESDDLALSVEWRDADGCLWSADFSENALALAELGEATVSMRDVVGAGIVFRLYQPAKLGAFSSCSGT